MDQAELKRLFGLRVQAMRRQHQLTQEQLAEAIDKSPDTVSNIETGRMSTKIETALRIAETFQISLSELFDFDETRAVKDRDHRRNVEKLVRSLSDVPAEKVERIHQLVKVALEL